MKPSDIQTPSMDNRPRIRDTSGQDHVVSTPAASFRRHRKAWLVGGIAGEVVLAMAAWVIGGWTSGGRSYDPRRVRLAQVTRGDLVRARSAAGRRSEERRVGHEGVSTCRARWSQDHSTKKHKQ